MLEEFSSIVSTKQGKFIIVRHDGFRLKITPFVNIPVEYKIFNKFLLYSQFSVRLPAVSIADLYLTDHIFLI